MSKNEIKRVYLEAGPNTSPTRLTFEVTRTDDGHEIELISGDVEALSDPDNEEAEFAAIRLAEDEWDDEAREKRRPLSHGEIQANRNRDEIKEDHEP